MRRQVPAAVAPPPGTQRAASSGFCSTNSTNACAFNVPPAIACRSSIAMKRESHQRRARHPDRAWTTRLAVPSLIAGRIYDARTDRRSDMTSVPRRNRVKARDWRDIQPRVFKHAREMGCRTPTDRMANHPYGRCWAIRGALSGCSRRPPPPELRSCAKTRRRRRGRSPHRPFYSASSSRISRTATAGRAIHVRGSARTPMFRTAAGAILRDRDNKA